jgi:KAP family P-loop domain
MDTKPASRIQEEAYAADPQFDFDLIGAALAEVLQQTTSGATVVGIHGPWGSGKTTLMHAIGRDLEAETSGARPIVVTFNAWKYQAKEALWRALILRLIGVLREEVADEEKQGRSTGPNELDELESSLYAAFEVQEAGPWSVNWRTVITEIASVALEVAQLGFGGRVVHFLFGKSKSKDDGVLNENEMKEISGALERTTVSRRVAQVQSIEQFLDAFKNVVENFRGERPVVVLIDDLDRCLPESALEVFEAIKLFLDAPGCGFVVAVDREVIRSGLAVRYAPLGEAGSPAPVIDADEYIEKTVAISYDVPRLSSTDIAALIDEARPPLELSDDQKRAIADALDWNPRRVKRFLNVIKVQCAIAVRMEAKGRSAPAPLLGAGDEQSRSRLLKTLLIGYRYPALIRRGDSSSAFKLQELVTAFAGSRRNDSAEEIESEAMKHLPADARRLIDERALWKLMEWGPGLNETRWRDEVETYFDWFRRTGVAPTFSEEIEAIAANSPSDQDDDDEGDVESEPADHGG